MPHAVPMPPRLAFALSVLPASLLGPSCGGEPAPRQPEPAATVMVPPSAAAPTLPKAEASGAAAAPNAAATLSLPSGLAFSCQSEAQCLAHRCNFSVGKCVWPCQTDNDCQPGFTCVSPACLPKLGN
jgi:hypothetical protein